MQQEDVGSSWFRRRTTARRRKQQLFLSTRIRGPCTVRCMAKKKGSELLKEARQKRDLTQEGVEKLTGISQELISYYENEKIKPRVKNALIMKRKLGIPLDAWDY